MSGRVVTSLALLLSMSLCSAALADPEKDQEAFFGLIIGSNTTHDEKVPPLRYADDDAVQNAALLTQLGAQIVMLTTFDAETDSLYPDMEPTPPTRDAVFAAMETLNGAMDEARSRGLSPVFYFFYSGHGDVEHNQGFVRLKDGRLTRLDLVKIVSESRASANHVIIDACKSYFMVFERGSGGTRKPVTSVIEVDDESIPENTGVFLSTSRATDSHEWEAFQSGIFSHEIRSALRGAADINLNGSVSYKEAAAFVWTANSSISNHRFRPNFFSRPPAGSDSSTAVLARVSDATGDRLVVGPGAGHHAYIEDDKGLRLADFHPGDKQKIVLLIPKRRPLFFRHPGSTEEFELPTGRKVRLESLTAKNRVSLTRGAEHVAFGMLFDEAFAQTSFSDYDNRPELVLSDDLAPRDPTWFRRSLGLASIVLGAVGGTLTGLAIRESNSVNDETSGLERHKINESIGNYNAGAATCYVFAGSAFASYLIWTLWPKDKVDLTIMAGVGPGLEMTVSF